MHSSFVTMSGQCLSVQTINGFQLLFVHGGFSQIQSHNYDVHLQYGFLGVILHMSPDLGTEIFEFFNRLPGWY